MQNPRRCMCPKTDKDALCACSTKLIIGRGPETYSVVGRGSSYRAGTPSFEQKRCIYSRASAVGTARTMAGSRAYSQRKNGRLNGSRTMKEVR